jgi:hypothetical protein
MFLDLRGCHGSTCSLEKTRYGPSDQPPGGPNIISELEKRHVFSTFLAIIDLSGMTDSLSNPENTFTLFATPDEFISLPKCKLDRGSARQIITSSLLPRKVSREMITSSPSFQVTTMNSYHLLPVSTMNFETLINGKYRLLRGSIQAGKSIIHVVDGLIHVR